MAKIYFKDFWARVLQVWAWGSGSVLKGNLSGITELETPVGRIHIQFNSTHSLLD